ncbi:hypothetical protein SBA2_270054 [Acidobacteriia bacterium SbA2]|nr:hypothetical protein SBA2_270054 [Acidobacteriia bacterium SbA2]
MLSPLAGQNLFALRLLQIGQIKRCLLERHCAPPTWDESWIMTQLPGARQGRKERED